MKRLYLGILLITSSLCVSTSRVKRFSGNGQQLGDWDWNNYDQYDDQLTAAQTKSTSQTNWPTKGSGNSIKGRRDPNSNRDGAWTQDGNWPSGDNPSDGYGMGWSTEPQGNNKGSAYPDGDGDQGGNLEDILGGVPGMDFPNFMSVPKTDFDCSLMPSQGYYGDVEAGCQVFHICQPGNRKNSFLCPLGTIFNQKYFVCDWWFNVNCSETPSYYDLNNEIYKEPTVVTEEIPVTTEKPLPWNTQDLDRKRPTKGWGNQPTTGNQNPSWKDTPSRRGSKSPSSVSTSRDVSNSWSRSDVQKEISVTWGASSGTTSGSFGSPSTSSNSFLPTAKPTRYDFDSHSTKGQNSVMSKRTGMVQTSAPFGTRMRKSTATSETNSRASTESYEPITTPLKRGNYGTSTTNIWQKGTDTYSPPATRGWLMDEAVTDISKQENDNAWNKDIDNFPTTKGWLKLEDIPETSINPTSVKGVWEQETTKRSEQSDQTDENKGGHKGVVTKSGHPGRNVRKFRIVSKQKKDRTRGQTQNAQSLKTSNRRWVKSSYEKQNLFDNSHTNSISRGKSWK